MKQGVTKQEYLRIKNLENLQLTLGSEVSQLRFDDRDRLHSLDSAAVEWKDGIKAWFIHGVQFPPQIWERVVNRTIPASEAITLTNVEMRRIAVQRLGVEKVLSDLNATPKDSWREYKLYQLDICDDYVLLDNLGRWTEKQMKYFGRFTKKYLKAQYLRMVDPSTAQTYFVRVPPSVEDIMQYSVIGIHGVDTCQEAVAWTFGMTAEQYVTNLERET